MGRLVFVIALASAAAGCSTGMNTQQVTAQHAEVSSRTKCDPQVLVQDRAVVDPTLVVSVAPLYSFEHSNEGTEWRLIGAEIRTRSPGPLSPAQVDRVLECHAARRALGRPVSPIAYDPYGETEGLLDIDVQSERDTYVVRLTTNNIDAARRVLAAANAYAGVGRDALASAHH
jgi:hypothetical protein